MGDVIDIRSRMKKPTPKSEPKYDTQQSYIRRKPESDDDLTARIERIKSSINRINELMAELRNLSGDKNGRGKVLQSCTRTEQSS